MNNELHAAGLQALNETPEKASQTEPASDTAGKNNHKIRLFDDDWEWLLRVDSLFVAVPLATVALVLTQLDICTAQSSTWLGPYCDKPLRAVFAGYIIATIASIFIGAFRDFKHRDTWKLLSEHVLVSPDFYKIFFDGIKNSAVCLAVSAFMMGLVRKLGSTNLHSDNVWFADLLSPAMPDWFFIVSCLVGWASAAVMLFLASMGARTAYFDFFSRIASDRKQAEPPMVLYRRSLVYALHRITFYNLFVIFLVLSCFHLLEIENTAPAGRGRPPREVRVLPSVQQLPSLAPHG